MKDLLNAVFSTLIAPLIAAIDRNTSAVSGFCQPASAPTTPYPETAPETLPDAGKKEKGKKTKATPAAAPVEAPVAAPEPVAVVSAPDSEEDDDEGEWVPTGEELVEIMEPLRPSKELIAELIAFKKDVLNYQAPARTMTDPAMRAKFHEKIQELLERQQA
jgi:hypothetical protein